jgi:hypothetical protein
MDLPAPIKGFIVKGAMLLAVLGPVIAAVGMFLSGIAGIASIVPMVSGAMAAIGAALSGPIGIILLVVAAIAGLYLAWKNNLGGIRDWTTKAAEDIKATFVGLGTSLSIVWNNIKDWAIRTWNNLHAGVRQIVADLCASVTGFFSNLANDLFNAGQNLMNRMAEGIRNAAGAVGGAIQDALAWVRSLLPGSDAKRGPLSDLFASGKALPQTFARGIMAGGGALHDVSRMFADDVGGQTLGPRLQQYGSGAQAGMSSSVTNSQPITITINNPTREASSLSTMRALRNLSALGVLIPAGA